MAEDVPGCLAGASSCAPSRNCAAVTGFDRACLSAAVPWRVPYLRVRCCFRCCLAHWQRTLGLDAVFGQWEREQSSHISQVNDGWWELPAASEVLYMHSSPFAWAPIRALAPAHAPGRDPGSQQHLSGLEVARATRNSAFAAFSFAHGDNWLHELPDSAPWPRVVINPGDGLVSARWLNYTRLQNSASRHQDGQVDTMEWFFSNTRLKAPLAMREGGTREVIEAAVPRGVMSHGSNWSLLLDGREALTHRAVALNCGCCMGLSYAERALKLQALRANNFSCDTGGGRDKLPHDEYVRLLLESRFVFSPAGHGHSNHREWEALVAGAVPVVDHSDDLAELWRGLPMVQVRDWSTVTPTFLESEWKRLQRQSWDLKKAYWPYWFGRFSHHMASLDA